MNGYKQVKVALIGAAGVGKTSLATMLNREAVYQSYISTIGIDIKFVYVHDDKVKIALWDLSGQLRFKEIIREFVKTSEMLIFCYDASDEKTYDQVVRLYRKYDREGYTKDKNLILVATKCDKVNNNEYELLGLDFNAKTGAKFIRTSAYTKLGREELISHISCLVTPRIEPMSLEENYGRKVRFVRLEDDKRRQEWCDCVIS